MNRPVDRRRCRGGTRTRRALDLVGIPARGPPFTPRQWPAAHNPQRSAHGLSKTSTNGQSKTSTRRGKGARAHLDPEAALERSSSAPCRTERGVEVIRARDVCEPGEPTDCREPREPSEAPGARPTAAPAEVTSCATSLPRSLLLSIAFCIHTGGSSSRSCEDKRQRAQMLVQTAK